MDELRQIVDAHENKVSDKQSLKFILYYHDVDLLN